MSKSIIEKLGITPGPWRWFGWFSKGRRNSMELTTNHSGRHYVMDFVRAGTQGALPRFRESVGDSWKDCIMTRCDKMGEEMDHNGEYTMTEPNALVIAAAPEMLEALIETCLHWEAVRYFPNCFYQNNVEAIKKATGKTWEEIKAVIED